MFVSDEALLLPGEPGLQGPPAEVAGASHALWWPGQVASRDPANLAQAVHASWAAGLPGRELSPGH